MDFPDNDDFTKSDRGLGAIFTIAPEMKRNPKPADASKADVFSLAKTLWMLTKRALMKCMIIWIRVIACDMCPGSGRNIWL